MRLARSRNRSRPRGQHHSGLRAAQSLRRCGEHHGRTAGVRDSRGPDQSRHERTAACGVRPERPGWADAGQGLAVGAGCRLPARSRQPGGGSAPGRRFPVPVWETTDDVPLGGHYDAKELFAEMQVPLRHDRPWSRDFALHVAVRWSDYSSFDQNTSWQTGLRWQPTEELTLRTNYAEVFRVPTTVELYSQRRVAEDYFDVDPCGNDPTPTQQANCAANGVPGGAYVQGDDLIPCSMAATRSSSRRRVTARSRPDLHAAVGQGAFREH